MRDGDEIERGRSWRRRVNSVDSQLNGATGLMQVKNILQVAVVELASSVELLRVALVGLDLERIRQEEDGDAEGADLEEESGGSGGRGGREGRGGPQ
jgi:hypothetical protein